MVYQSSISQMSCRAATVAIKGLNGSSPCCTHVTSATRTPHISTLSRLKFKCGPIAKVRRWHALSHKRHTCARHCFCDLRRLTYQLCFKQVITPRIVTFQHSVCQPPLDARRFAQARPQGLASCGAALYIEGFTGQALTYFL